MYGLRPVPEIPVLDLHLSRLRQDRERAGQAALPQRWPVRRASGDPDPVGGGSKAATTTAVSGGPLQHTPGLQIIHPSNPFDREGPAHLRHAAGMTRSSHGAEARLSRRPGRGARRRVHGSDRPGKRRTRGAGDDRDRLGAMFHEALQAVEQAEDLDAELIDLRTLWPLDIGRSCAACARPGAAPSCRRRREHAGSRRRSAPLIQERCLPRSRPRSRRITGWDTPFPYTLESEYCRSRRASSERCAS